MAFGLLHPGAAVPILQFQLQLQAFQLWHVPHCQDLRVFINVREIINGKQSVLCDVGWCLVGQRAQYEGRVCSLTCLYIICTRIAASDFAYFARLENIFRLLLSKSLLSVLASCRLHWIQNLHCELISHICCMETSAAWRLTLLRSLY